MRERASRNPASLIDCRGGTVSAPGQYRQCLHACLLGPQERMSERPNGASIGDSHDLQCIVDPKSLTVKITRESADILHPRGDGPEESVPEVGRRDEYVRLPRNIHVAVNGK